MKILVLATPRSGSTSLTKLIYSHLELSEYTIFIEPFNSNFYTKYKIDGFDFETYTPLQNFENLLVKSLILFENIEYPIKSFVDTESYINWCVSFFDKIIILDRKDKVSQSQSFVINETLFREMGLDWHYPKHYDLSKIDKVYLEKMVVRYEESSKLLLDTSNKHNIPIYYYEDIFLNDSGQIVELFDYLNVKCDVSKYNDYLINKKGKVRLDNNITKII
jgi:LPS sulfotransferase NodH